MEDRADNKTRMRLTESSSKLHAITKSRFVRVQFCIVFLALLIGAFVSPGSALDGIMTSPTPTTLNLAISRSSAYYLGSIPAPESSNLLLLNWTASVSDFSNGHGSIQSSHENATWSNLESFDFISGVAQGRQTIDSSWAWPGANYLRVSYWDSGTLYFSNVLTLKVSINYATTMLLTLSPFVAVVGVGATVYFVRKREREPTAPTP